MKIAPYQSEQFISDIAKNENIFAALVYGPEPGLVSIRSKKIAQAIVGNLSDPFLVCNLSEKRIIEDPALLTDEFFSIPMLGGRKIIIVSDAGNKTTEALKLIFENNQKLTNANFILISASDLDKNSSLRKLSENSPHIASIACYEDSEATIVQIIRQKLQEDNLTTEEGLIRLMVERYGKNRLIILNELEKLALFAGNDKNITLEIAEQIITDNDQTSVNQFVNYFADLDPINSLNCANKLFKEKFNSVTLCRVLSNYFIKLKLAKTNIENGSALEAEIKNQRLFFKQEEIFKKHLRKWTIKKLKDLLLKLQELEIRCKTSNLNHEITLKSFINYAYLKYKAR